MKGPREFSQFGLPRLAMDVRDGLEFQKCGKSPVFLDPDPADLREGWHRISEMWQIPYVFLTLTPRICVSGGAEF